jgi:hypothetical protein
VGNDGVRVEAKLGRIQTRFLVLVPVPVTSGRGAGAPRAAAGAVGAMTVTTGGPSMAVSAR